MNGVYFAKSREELVNQSSSLIEWRVKKWWRITISNGSCGREKDAFFDKFKEACDAGKGRGPENTDIIPEEIFVLSFDNKAGYLLSELKVLLRVLEAEC